MQLGAFWCFFAYYIRAPQTSSFACYMRPYSGPFLSFLAYGGSLKSVSSHSIWGPPQISFLTYYGGPSDHFFAYYIGASRSLSSLTIYMGPSDQFHCLLYAPPLRSVSLHAIGGPPQILVFSQNIWGPPQISFSAYYMGPPQVSFFAYYMGPPQISFCADFLGAPLRSVFSLTSLYGALSDQLLRLLYGGPH